MNRKLFTRIASMLLAICMVATLGACSKKGDDLSDEYSYYTEVITTTSTVETSSEENTTTDATQQTQSSANNINSDKTTSLTRDQFIAKMPKELKGKTLTYMYWNDPKKQMDGEAIKKFEKATGCKVECEVVSYDSFQETLSVKISSGKAPDLVRLLGNVTWQITSLQPITNSGYNFNDSAWDAQLMKDFTFNGNCYATNLKDSAISDVAVLYYNKKALQDAEMDNQDPYKIWEKNPKDWTWEKFWSLCEQFVNANKGKSGYAGATFEYGDSLVRAMGGYLLTYDSAAGKFINGCKNSETIAGWQTTLAMREKGLLLNQHSETSFDQGKTLFFLSGPFSARAKDARQSALKERNRLGVVPLPTDSAKQVMYEYTAFGIPEGAKNAALVPYYLRYVLDKSSYDMDKVYCSKEARKVVDYACSLPNRIYAYSAGASGTLSALSSAGSGQVKQTLDAYSPQIDEFVLNENDRITYFD